MKTLVELYKEHQGKLSDKWSSYLPTYDRLFAELRDKPINLLEIGVQNGGSLEIWAKYFPNAKNIIGIDINPRCGLLKFDDPRIQVRVQDATLGLPIIETSSLDIIIDDGSHEGEDQINAFEQWIDFLRYGGYYAIEDLHCDQESKLLGYLWGRIVNSVRDYDFVSCDQPFQRVEILNSMIVLKSGDHGLGTRFIAGSEELVAGGHRGLHGTTRNA